MNKEELQKKHLEAISKGSLSPFNENLAASCTAITLQSMIDENKSILEMAKLHMDERAVTVLNQRIFNLENLLNQK